MGSGAPRTEPSFYARAFTIAASLGLAWLTLRVLEPVGGALAWAAILGFLLWPLNERLRRRLHGRHGTAAIALTLGALLGLAGPIVLIGASFVRQAAELVERMPTAAEALHAPWLTRLGDRLELVPVDLGDVRQRLLDGLASGLQFLAGRLGTVFLGAVGAVTGVGFTLFILFFILRDGEKIVRTFLGLVPIEEKTKQKLFTHIGVVTRAVVVGSLATAAAQGTLVGVAFAVLRLPSPVVFGVIAAVVSVLPIGGTALVWGPAAVVLALSGRYAAAGLLVVWGVLVVSMVDNLIRPRIVSGRANVPTLMVFLGIIGGIASFGLIGVLLGPIVLVTTLEVARLLVAPPEEPAVEARGHATSRIRAATADSMGMAPRDRGAPRSARSRPQAPPSSQ